MSDLWKSFVSINSERRTSKDYDGRAISKETLDELLRQAILAPNHGLNEPWRFYVMSPLGIPAWLTHLEEKLSADEWKALQKNVEKIKKVGALIFASVLRDKNEMIDQENFAAASAAIQNLLLAATAKGIRSYWATGKLVSHPATRSYVQMPESERFLGALWLGYGALADAKPRKHYDQAVKWLSF